METAGAKDIKHLEAILKRQWGAGLQIRGHLHINSEGRVFSVSEDFARLDTQGLRIETIGLYIGRLVPGGFKLSIEGSQLLGPYANQNVTELCDEEFSDWMRGLDVGKAGQSPCFQIIKNKAEFFGCARHTNGRLLNLVPKERRIRSFA
jgi:NOL1/NOP2/fmu family ribosome biogenesis protein